LGFLLANEKRAACVAFIGVCIMLVINNSALALAVFRYGLDSDL